MADSIPKVFFEAADRPPASYYGEEQPPEASPAVLSAVIEASTAEDVHKNFASQLSTSSVGESVGGGVPALGSIPFKTKIDPQEWARAPEFIPRSRKLLTEAFGEEPPPLAPRPPPPAAMSSSGIMDTPPVFPFPRPPLPGRFPMLPPPFPRPFLQRTFPPPPPPLSFIPNGYSANITAIQAGIGPPIPAIVLKKKRRKRHKAPRLMKTNTTSPTAIHPSDPNDDGGSGCESEPDQETSPESTSNLSNTNSEPKLNPCPEELPPFAPRVSTIEAMTGSCPDLSDSQLQIWDDLLYDTVVEKPQMTSSPPPNIMQTSAYELVPPALLDMAYPSPEIRRLDEQMKGGRMTDSQVIDSIQRRLGDSDGRPEKSLQAEIEELTFRPAISKYGYPQLNSDRFQLATFHHDSFAVDSKIVESKDLDKLATGEECVEDAFEGMNIRVNAFDACDDLALSESECPEPSRFQQIHWALQRNSQKYAAELKAPERVCCSIS